MTTESRQNTHKEAVLQQHLIDALVGGQGYIERNPQTDYDRKRAMDPGLVVNFLQSTQAEQWAKLVVHYATSAETMLLTQLERDLKARGALDVLCNGIKIVPGIAFSLCFFRPASGPSPQRLTEYEANILSVMQEVAYSEKQGNRLNILVFVNGLPSPRWRQRTD